MLTARIPLKEWIDDGPAGVSYIQGAKWDGRQMVVGQADDVAGQSEQNTVLRTHNTRMEYLGVSCTVKEGGHGSSFGVFVEAGQTHILLGHAKLGLVRLPLADGWAKPVRLKDPTAREFAGRARDWVCDQANDLACVRIGEVFIGYTLSSLLAGQPKQLFRTRVPNFLDRFQGHYLTRINGALVLAIHRDVETKGRSEARLLRITSSSSWRVLDKINTTGMGDEAEGFLDYHGRLWIVKRTGGNGAGRYVALTGTVYKTSTPKPAPAPAKPGSPARDPKAAGVWRVVNVNSWLWGRLAKNGRLVDEDRWIQREPGFEITTGHHFTTIGGVRYLVTEAGRHYTAKYLRKIR